MDSLKGDDDFTPFRNIMNEFYARDTSRKIRSVFKAKGMSGKHLTGTVIYGYLWDEKREHWLVDEEAAEVVRRIFSLTLEGYGPYQIACKLSADRIEIPVVHLARFNEGVNRSKPIKDPYGWGSSTIVNILKKREYLGHTINFKTRKHFKDKKSHYVSEDEWTIFENTHEAIIDQQTFDLAQKIRSNVRRYPNGWGEAAPLTGSVSYTHLDVYKRQELLRDFIRTRPELREYAVRIDDGFTDSNFERPSFKKMLEDVKAGRTNCIIVKDYCAIIGLNQKDLENQGILA